MSTLKGQVYERLKQMILAGTLRPGERLHERDLTERFRVSRTPLREALNQLAREGLVVNRPQRGHYVQGYEPEAVADLYALRAVLENHAIRLAIERMGEQDRAELQGLRRELRRYRGSQRQEEEELRAGQRVHEIIARASGDAFLYETLQRLYDRLRMFVWLDALYADDARLTRREHDALIATVLSGDAPEAAAAATAHIERSRANVERALRLRAAIAV